MLIIFNTSLESFWLPYYKITADNLVKIDYGEVVNYISACLLSLLNFYTMIFLIFRINKFKKIFPYSILYLILNIVSVNLFSDNNINNIVGQIFIPVFVIIFSYLFSNKNWKYILYGFLSYAINYAIQYVCYLYKLRFVDFESISYFNRLITSFDFLILMLVIILIKEIIIKRKEAK